MGDILKDKRSGWIAKLKVGDSVFLERKNKTTLLCKVNRVTATGKMKVGDYDFDHKGMEVGSGFMESYITEYNDFKAQNLKDADRREYSIVYLQNLPLETFTLSQIDQICKAIEVIINNKN